MTIPSARKIENLSPKTRGILSFPVSIEEKLDGSWFSFMETASGELLMRSKGRDIEPNTTDKQFVGAVATVKQLYADGLLLRGVRYIGEAICRPKQNVLAYERVPEKCIALFDAVDASGRYMSSDTVRCCAMRLGIGHAPELWTGTLANEDDPIATLNSLLETESCLGGQKVEGLVLKAREVNDKYGRPWMVKYVSQQFREKASVKKTPKALAGATEADEIAAALCTEARWLKAVQHLRDDGALGGSMKDIGPLLAELHRDIEAEEEGWIKDRLYAAFRKRILRGAVNGFPRWYEAQLTEAVAESA